MSTQWDGQVNSLVMYACISPHPASSCLPDLLSRQKVLAPNRLIFSINAALQDSLEQTRASPNTVRPAGTEEGDAFLPIPAFLGGLSTFNSLRIGKLYTFRPIGEKKGENACDFSVRRHSVIMARPPTAAHWPMRLLETLEPDQPKLCGLLDLWCPQGGYIQPGGAYYLRCQSPTDLRGGLLELGPVQRHLRHVGQRALVEDTGKYCLSLSRQRPWILIMVLLAPGSQEWKEKKHAKDQAREERAVLGPNAPPQPQESIDARFKMGIFREKLLFGAIVSGARTFFSSQVPNKPY